MSPDSSAQGQPSSDFAGDAYVTFSPKLMAMESPAKSRPAVALHEMAHRLIAQQVDRGRRGVVVCAPSRGAGASLLSANLAIAIAQAGVSVLLVDGNLHDPGLNALIALSPPPSIGLQQVLREPAIAVSEAIQPDILPGFSVLFGGGACPDASELIGGVRCAALFEECVRDFEYTIVDAPPANRTPDTRRLVSYIGYGLIVARRNRTYVDDVATLAGELAQDHAEAIGTIFNAA
jgi:Mrp family chromosome partitioning ATPase